MEPIKQKPNIVKKPTAQKPVISKKEETKTEEIVKNILQEAKKALPEEPVQLKQPDSVITNKKKKVSGAGILISTAFTLVAGGLGLCGGLLLKSSENTKLHNQNSALEVELEKEKDKNEEYYKMLAESAETLEAKQAIIDQLTSEKNNLTLSLTQAQASVASLQASLTSTQAQLIEKEALLNQIQTQLNNANADIRTLQSEKEILQSQIQTLNQEKTTLNSQISTLSASIIEYERQIASKNLEIQNLQNQLTQAQNTISQKDAEIEKLNEDKITLNNEITAKNSTILELNAQIEELEANNQTQQQIISDLTDDINNLEYEKGLKVAEITALNEELTIANNTIKQNEKTIEELEKRVQELENSGTENDSLISELQSQIANLTQENLNLSTNVVNLQKQLETKEQTILNLTSEKQSLSIQLSQANDTISLQATLIEEYRNRIANLENQLGEKNAETERLNQEILTLTNEKLNLEQTISNLNSNINDLNEQISLKNSQIESLTNELQVANATIEQKNTQIANLETSIAGKNAEITQKEQEITTLNARIGDLETDIESKQIEITSLESQVQAKNQEIQDLQALKETLEKTIQDLQAEIEELQNIINSVYSPLEYFTISDGTITSYNAPEGVNSIIIPTSYSLDADGNVINGNDYSITAIADNAFKTATNLTDIKILSTIETIGAYAFSGCTALTSILLPNSLTSVGTYAFNLCTALTAVNITNIESWLNTSFSSGASNPLYYAKNLYVKGELLTNLVIPEGFTEVKQYVFNGATCLQSVNVPVSVEKFGMGAFEGCTELTKVNIHDVNKWSQIEFVHQLPGGFLQLNCSSNPLYYAKNLYLNNELVTDLVIPEGTTKVSPFAFVNATALQSITIPESVTELDFALYGAGQKGVFQIKITNLQAWCNIPFTCSFSTNWTTGEIISIINGNPLNCAEGTAHLVLNGNILNNIKFSDYGITELPNASFMGYSMLSGVNFEGVTSVGKGVFAKSGLTSYSNTSNILTIGNLAFAYSNITEFNFDQVTSIGNYAFAECYLNELTIPSCITSVTDYMFAFCKMKVLNLGNLTSIPNNSYFIKGCSAINKVIVPSTITSIGTNVFIIANCYGLMEIYNKSSLDIVAGADTHGGIAKHAKNVYTNESDAGTFINVNGFEIYKSASGNGIVGYNGGETGILPETIEGINSLVVCDYAFATNSRMKNITLSSLVTGIGDYAFKGCENLTNVTMPTTMSYIGTYAFSECKNLTNVTLPTTMSSIGEYAFYTCSSLTEISIPQGIKNIGRATFSGCTSLNKLTLPESVTDIGIGAFNNCPLKNGVHISSIESWLKINFEWTQYSGNGLIDCEDLYIDGNVVREIVVPETITKIDVKSFKNLKINTLVLHSNITKQYTNFEIYFPFIENVVINSASIYTSLAYEDSYSNLISNDKTNVYVLKSIVDDVTNVNSYLTDTSIYEKTEDPKYPGYYKFKRIVTAQ